MPDPEKWFPTTVRITMIQVSEGSTYDESQVPGLPSGSGGAGGGGGTGNGAPSSTASVDAGCSLGAMSAPSSSSSLIALGVALAAAWRRRYFSKTCAAAKP